MDQGPLIHINGGAHSGVPGVAAQTRGRQNWSPRGVPMGPPGGGVLTPQTWGAPQGGPARAPPGPPVWGAKLAPPGDGGHLTDFVAN